MKDRGMYQVQAYSKLEDRWVTVRRVQGKDAAVDFKNKRVNPNWETRLVREARDGDGRPAR